MSTLANARCLQVECGDDWNKVVLVILLLFIIFGIIYFAKDWWDHR